jgi:hypothetical protein
MKSYNEFSGRQRSRAQKVAKQSMEIWCAHSTYPVRRLRAGEGHHHAEDYSEPFAAGKSDHFYLRSAENSRDNAVKALAFAALGANGSFRWQKSSCRNRCWGDLSPLRGRALVQPYNGFSGRQRSRAQTWLNRQWKAGALARPMQCVACGQSMGIIDAHAEDYSEPFAAGKTDQYHLCFTCHMMVHCRFGNPEAWQYYKSVIRRGGRFAPSYERDIGGLCARHLKARRPVPDEQGKPPDRSILDDID